MKHILEEYGLAILAIVAATACMSMLMFQISQEGSLWQMITYWIYAAC